MYSKAILHLDMDTFFVSVERRKDPSLQDRPVIIGGSSERGVVSSCSYEARRFGVRSGMAMKLARRLCPEAVYLRGDFDSYARESAVITEIIAAEAPLFSRNSIDEFHVDLTGLDRYLGAFHWSQELRRRIIRETGLPVSAGVSRNCFVSKMATSAAKPCGEKLVPAGEEKLFLSPIPVGRMHGVGEVTARKLIYMGVRRIGVLSQIPQPLLLREFGKYGAYLWERANGIDPSPIIPYRDEKSLSRERTFQTDTIDLRFLRGQLTDMTGKLAFALRQAGKLTSCVTVKIRYTDFQTYTRQRTIDHTAGDRVLIRLVLELFEQLYTRRQLVRLVGVKFSGLARGHLQISLLDDTPRELNLLAALDRIRQRFGPDAIRWG